MELAQKATALESYLKTVPEVIEQFKEAAQLQNIDDAKSRLLKLKIQEHELLAKYPEDNRMVTATRENIEMVKDFIANQDITSQNNVRSGRNPLFQQLERELAITRVSHVAQREKNDSIKRQLDTLKDQLRQLTNMETRLEELNFRVETNRETYKNFTGKLEDSRIQDAMDSQKMVNVVVIEKPMVPAKPIRPRKKLNILVGIILGIACSLFYALFVEQVMARKPNGS